ncbi:MAG: hypothetical protein ABIQ16_15295 [Polyangiaceae bacterium]
MTRIGLGKSRIWGALLETATDGPDFSVAPRPSWWVVGMVAASSLALVATSNEQPPQLEWKTSIAGPQASLTADAPNATFLVHVKVNSLGPNDSNSALNARAKIYGRIAGNEAMGTGRPFVAVQLEGTEALSALTEFSTGQALLFTGNCAQPSSGPPSCEAHFQLSLSRADGGQRGGTVLVDWSVDFDSSSPSREAAQALPPWTIDVYPL